MASAGTAALTHTHTQLTLLCRPLQVKLSERVVSTELGLLIRRAQPWDQGLYSCLSTENGFKRTAAKIHLRVLSAGVAGVLAEGQSSPRARPEELLAAFSRAESLAVRQYCQERAELRQLQQRRRGQQHQWAGPLRGDLAKLKPLLERRKSRHRRNQVPEV